jgi:hypothetical protein
MLYMQSNASFQNIGAAMLAEWDKGLNLSINRALSATISAITCSSGMLGRGSSMEA